MSDFDPRKYHLTPSQKALERLFPERQVMVRSDERTRSLRFSTAAQVSATAILALVAGWVGFSSYMYLNNEAIIATKQEEVARAQTAYKGLLAQVTVYRDKISEVTENLEENHARSLSLADQATVPSVALNDGVGKDRPGQHMRNVREGLAEPARQGAQDIASAATDLDRERATQERAGLRQQLRRLEQEMTTLATAAETFDPNQSGVDDLEVRRVVLQRDLATSESQSLKEQIKTLENRIAELQNTQLQLVKNFSTVARNRSQDLEEALKGTGLSIDALVKDRSSSLNQGGPFIPMAAVDQADPSAKTLVSLNEQYSRWNSMQGLAEILPIGQPLRDYRVTSTFGVRVDPVNGDRAIHEGLDLSAPYQTPVAATGEGRVSFAGWRGRYGRVVEIDHGNGLKTRYGHLYKTLVRKGDLVDRNTRIGLLGNSGRSTGPHVHYEVIVNGQPCDPSIFIKAGINVL